MNHEPIQRACQAWVNDMAMAMAVHREHAAWNALTRADDPCPCRLCQPVHAKAPAEAGTTRCDR